MKPRSGPSGLRPAAAAMAAVALVAACARQGAPPGGPEDRRPPVIVATDPDTFEVRTDFEGPVRFVFDERISERVDGGALDDAVLVSPRTGGVRVRRGRREIEVELDGGFQPGRVYRVTLLPVIRDLFNNQLRDPFEIVFSTGGEPAPNAVAGQAWDRITGGAVQNATVLAVQEGDSSVHVSRADTGGVFAFRFLPPGRYTIVAFQDRDRDGDVGEGEMQGRQPIPVGEADTVLVDVAMLMPDTSPALLTAVEILDSVTLVLQFDDYLDPTAPTITVGVDVTHESQPAPSLTRVFHESEYEAWVMEARDSLARLDSLDAAVAAQAAAAAAEAAAAAAPDSAAQQEGVRAEAPDSVGAAPPPEIGDTAAAAAGDSTLAPPGVERPAGPTARPVPPLLPVTGASAPRVGAEGEAPTGPGGVPLPARRLVAVLRAGLEVNEPYQVRVSGVRNIAGLVLGGGEAAIVREPPPPPDTAAADTTGLVPDSTLAPPDTAAVRDSIPAPPDTGRVSPLDRPRRPGR